MEPDLERSITAPADWVLDPELCFFNHGSFGSCPRQVLAFQQRCREEMERDPIRFFVRELESRLDEARRGLAAFLNADAEDLVFVPNATAGVNTVLRSLDWNPGDELLLTDHEYNACRNAAEYAVGKRGGRIVTASIPFPLRSEEEMMGAILKRIGSRTRLVLLDHVTSQTGIVMPLQKLATEIRSLGVDLLVDGAHAPGMLPLDLRQLGTTYYTGNCHKWLCAPKGAGFLHVSRDRQRLIHPLAISHGANSPRKDRSRFQIEFAWTGTWDPSAYLAVPEALRFMGSILPGGWEALKDRNRRLALAGRKLLCEALGLEAPCPESCIGSLASLPIPDGETNEPPLSPLYLDPLQAELRHDYGCEVPIIPWPSPPKRLLRISAQAYNSLPQYRRLAEALSRVWD